MRKREWKEDRHPSQTLLDCPLSSLRTFGLWAVNVVDPRVCHEGLGFFLGCWLSFRGGVNPGVELRRQPRRRRGRGRGGGSAEWRVAPEHHKRLRQDPYSDVVAAERVTPQGVVVVKLVHQRRRVPIAPHAKSLRPSHQPLAPSEQNWGNLGLGEV